MQLQYILCSRKCASPGTSAGSEKLPTPMHNPAADYKYQNLLSHRQFDLAKNNSETFLEVQLSLSSKLYRIVKQ